MYPVDTKKGRSPFSEPYALFSPEKLLAHFKAREGIHYFPVLDPEESSREKIDQILKNRFDFNHEAYARPEGFDWAENPSSDIEWLILLHKFYYAPGLGAAYDKTKDRRYLEKWIALTEAWIDTVPVDILSSDVTGRRIQNWIYAHYYFVTRHPNAPIFPDFYEKFLRSLEAQVAHLSTHLTPARNHRTLELYAVFLAAVVFPEFKQSEAWRHFAIEELSRNIQQDILPDGVHCELSTDYHHIVLKNYLNIRKLAAMNEIALPEAMDRQIKKALEFALFVHKPDGNIPSLSDGDARSFLDLLEKGAGLYNSEAMRYVASRGRLGQAPAERSKGFPEGGYYILRSGWGQGTRAYEDEHYLVFDCGPLGAGNHGHMDLLSFEAAAFGRSLVIDPGRYTYDESGPINWRVRFRGTAYHNTILVDKKNQTAYRPGKRKFKIKGPQPDFELKSFVTGAGFDYLHGVAKSHEYEAVHTRKIFFVCGEYWVVSDFLKADQRHDYDLLFHLTDQAQGKVSVRTEKETRLVEAPYLLMAQPFEPEMTVFVEEGFVSRTYGKKHAAPILRFSRTASDAAFQTLLYPCREASERPEISVRCLPVSCAGKPCGPGQAFSLLIEVKKKGVFYQDCYFSAAPSFGKSYCFGELQYPGRFLFFRRDEAGRLLRLHHDPEVPVAGLPERLR